MIYLDFTQIYPSLAAILMTVTGFFSLWLERKSYASRGLMREAKWSKYIGIIWIGSGIILYLGNWVWRNFIW